MKEYIKKLALAMIAGIIVILVGAFALDNVLEMNGARERSISSENKYITDFYQRGGMIGHGKDGLSVTPVDAYIQDGVIYVKATLKNNTGHNLVLYDFGDVVANVTTTYFKTDYEDDTVLENGKELDVLFSFGAYDVMMNNKDYPTSVTFELGASNKANNNYEEYDLRFTISWLYNAR